MKIAVTFLLAFSLAVNSQAQVAYDSVTISRFVERIAPEGKEWNSIKYAGHTAFMVNEHAVWINSGEPDSLSYIFSLTKRIRDNGAKSLGRCFIPRHSINFYKDGKISRYVLVCFQCNGFEFSDMPLEHTGLLVSEEVRMQQIGELKILFKDLL